MIIARLSLLFVLFAAFAYASVRVAVSIPPQRYFVRQIAGDLADISVMLPPGSAPETYAPRPSQLKALKKSDLYFLIGVEFEQAWRARWSRLNPALTFVDTAAAIKKIPMQPNADAHEGLDPHIWMSPENVAKMVPIIRDALIAKDPAHAALYRANAARFLKRLDALDRQIRSRLAHLRHRSFIVFHPAFGYFAKSYGLKQIAIEKEGKEPTLRYFKKVIDYAKAHDIHTIFVAPQFSQKSARYIARKIGGNVVTIDPLAQKWDENLIEVAKRLEEAD